MKRAVIRLFCLAAFAAALTGAVCLALNMQKMWANCAACSIAPSTGDELALLDALYPDAEWTAYTQDAASLSVTNEALPARSAQVQELSFLGDPSRIAFFPLVSGRLPREGESGVCALDADTAWALFRSTDANSNCVRANGDSLLVVGILDVERPLLMVPAAQDARFDRLAASSREALEALASALGEETDPFELSGSEIARIALLLCIFPIVLRIASALGVLRRRGGWRREAVNLLLWALFAGAVLAILWCVPVRLLPARWSDLGFYAELLDSFRARDLRLPDARDLLLQSGLVRAGILCLMACVAFWIERKCLKCEKPS